MPEEIRLRLIRNWSVKDKLPELDVGVYLLEERVHVAGHAEIGEAGTCIRSSDEVAAWECAYRPKKYVLCEVGHTVHEPCEVARIVTELADDVHTHGS